MGHKVAKYDLSLFSKCNVRFSGMYDECVNTYRQERTKTEKLLGDLLPKQVIQQMKKVVLDNHSLLIGNISNRS